MHPEQFCAAGSMGGGLRNSAEQAAAINMAIPVWKKNNFGFFLVNGDQDRPDAFQDFAQLLKDHDIDHKVVILADAKHNLGLYYQRSVQQLLAFLGQHLKS